MRPNPGLVRVLRAALLVSLAALAAACFWDEGRRSCQRLRDRAGRRRARRIPRQGVLAEARRDRSGTTGALRQRVGGQALAGVPHPPHPPDIPGVRLQGERGARGRVGVHVRQARLLAVPQPRVARRLRTHRGGRRRRQGQAAASRHGRRLPQLQCAFDPEARRLPRTARRRLAAQAVPGALRSRPYRAASCRGGRESARVVPRPRPRRGQVRLRDVRRGGVRDHQPPVRGREHTTARPRPCSSSAARRIWRPTWR